MGIKQNVSLVKDIFLLKVGRPRLFSITLNMTDECNLKCKMCNIWKRKKKNELDAKIFRQQMERSKILRNIKLFNFAGGEPFLVKELGEFVAAVADNAKPMQIRFVSNGFATKLIKEKMEEFLANHKNISFGVKISLDGLKETHDKIRGVKGTFENAVKTIDELNELKKKYCNRLAINIGYTVNKENFKEVDCIYELANEKNVGFLFKPVLRIKKFSNEDSVGGLFLNDEEIKILRAYNKEFMKKYRSKGFFEGIIYKHFYRMMDKYLYEPRNYIKCYALSASCYVIPNGDVTSCLLLNDVFGNLNEKNFDEIWSGQDTEKRRKEILNGECHCLTPCDTIPSLMVNKFPFY